MKRFLVAVAASSLALVVVVGGLGVLAVRSGFAAPIAEAAAFGPLMGQLPPEFQGLQDLSPEERFGHFLGGQMKFTDANNAARSVAVTPGTVSSVSSDKLTIKANDGSVGNQTYTLTGDTRIHKAGMKWAGGNTQATPKPGDKVVVVTMDGSSNARAVIIGGPDGFRPRGGPFQRGS